MTRIASAALAAVVLMAGSAAAQAGAKPVPKATPAEVDFMQDMMHHHAQAIEICDLAPGRAGAAVSTLCKRVIVSQRDEIEVMSNWLRARGEQAPEVLGHHHGGAEALEHAMMPGMLTPAQLNALGHATGPAFDRLFLEGMIRHHQGAITMVKKLLETPGAGQDSEIFGIASGIDTDQRAEIERMSKLLNAPR